MKLKIFIIAALCSLSTFAQQEPQYTQYMYNQSVINPAYMINEPGLIRVGSLYRSQWAGLDGAPKTANVFANIPLNEKLELGVNYVNDQIGNVLTQNYFNLNAAYRINVAEETNLSFGVKLGVDNLSLDFSNQDLAGDNAFINGQTTSLDVGAGVFLFEDNYYVGLSTPNIIPYEIASGTQTVLYKKSPTLYFAGGYVHDLTEDWKLKPSSVVKMVSGAPISVDLSLNVLYSERFELGVSYRYDDAIAALAGFQVTPDLKLGYSYDFNTSELADFNNGSHEFVLIYTFDLLGLSKRYTSPRFY